MSLQGHDLKAPDEESTVVVPITVTRVTAWWCGDESLVRGGENSAMIAKRFISVSNTSRATEAMNVLPRD